MMWHVGIRKVKHRFYTTFLLNLISYFLPSAILFTKGKVLWDFGMGGGGGGMGLQPDPSGSLPSSSYPGRQEQLYAPIKLMHVEFLWQRLGFRSHSLISVKICRDGF